MTCVAARQVPERPVVAEAKLERGVATACATTSEPTRISPRSRSTLGASACRPDSRPQRVGAAVASSGAQNSAASCLPRAHQRFEAARVARPRDARIVDAQRFIVALAVVRTRQHARARSARTRRCSIARPMRVGERARRRRGSGCRGRARRASETRARGTTSAPTASSCRARSGWRANCAQGKLAAILAHADQRERAKRRSRRAARRAAGGTAARAARTSARRTADTRCGRTSRPREPSASRSSARAQRGACALRVVVRQRVRGRAELGARRAARERAQARDQARAIACRRRSHRDWSARPRAETASPRRATASSRTRRARGCASARSDGTARSASASLPAQIGERARALKRCELLARAIRSGACSAARASVASGVVRPAREQRNRDRRPHAEHVVVAAARRARAARCRRDRRCAAASNSRRNERAQPRCIGPSRYEALVTNATTAPRAARRATSHAQRRKRTYASDSTPSLRSGRRAPPSSRRKSSSSAPATATGGACALATHGGLPSTHDARRERARSDSGRTSRNVSRHAELARHAAREQARHRRARARRRSRADRGRSRAARRRRARAPPRPRPRPPGTRPGRTPDRSAPARGSARPCRSPSSLCTSASAARATKRASSGGVCTTPRALLVRRRELSVALGARHRAQRARRGVSCMRERQASSASSATQTKNADAHVAVQIEERLVDARQVARPHDRVLVREQRGDQRDAARSTPRRARARARRRAGTPTVATCSSALTTSAPLMPNHTGIECSFSLRVEALVLQRVQHVEARDPARDADHEQPRRERDRRAERDPRAARRERHRQAEDHVAQRGEALGQRVAERQPERDRRQQQRQPAEQRGAGDEHRARARAPARAPRRR